MAAQSDPQNNQIVGIIPARIGSEEIDAKVLLDLGGKPVIGHVLEKAFAAGVFDEIVVAADDDRIIEVAKTLGAKTYKSQQEHVCGTDRCAEAAQALCSDAGIVVNIQADEPFLNPAMIPLVVEPLISGAEWDMTTLCCQSHDLSANASEFTVKVVKAGATPQALYFSRAIVPYPRCPERCSYLHHIGVYAYRMDALRRFFEFGPSELELAEGLEQLRALEANMRIQVIETDLDYPRISIDTEEDLEKARELIDTST